MPLTTEEIRFLKSIFQRIKDEPLLPGDPNYQPIYETPGCEDPVQLLERNIEFK